MKMNKILGVAAIISAFAFASCSASLTDAETDVVQNNASIYLEDTNNILKISSSTFSNDDYIKSESAAKTYDVTFNKKVDLASAKKAFHFYNVESAESGFDFVKQGSEIAIDDAKLSNNDKTVTFTVNLSNTDYFMVYLDAAKLKAQNGAMLDNDGDEVFGEENDDSIIYWNSNFYFKAIDASESVTDNFKGNKFVTAGDGQFASNARFITTKATGTEEYDYIKTFEIYVPYKFYDTETDYKSIFDNYVKIQKLTKDGWKDLSVTSSLFKKLDEDSPYSEWVYHAEFEKITDVSTEIRVYATDVQKLVTKNKIAGFFRKFDLNSNNKSTVIISDSIKNETKNVIVASLVSIEKMNKDSVVDKYGTTRGTKIYSITINITDDTSYKTDINYKENSEKGYSYCFNGLDTSTLLSKLHFYDKDYNEIKATGTVETLKEENVNGTDNTNGTYASQVKIVFANSITIPSDILYIYGDKDLSISYKVLDDSVTPGTYEEKSTATCVLGEETNVEKLNKYGKQTSNRRQIVKVTL